MSFISFTFRKIAKEIEGL